MANLYVANIPYSTTEEELAGVFGEYATVKSAKIITDHESGRSRGFGFVEVEGDGGDVITQLNGADMGGRELRVNIAKDRPERKPRNNY